VDELNYGGVGHGVVKKHDNWVLNGGGASMKIVRALFF